MRLGESAPAAAAAGGSTAGFGPAASKVYAVEQGLSIGGYGEMLYQGFDAQRDDGADSGRNDQLDFLRAVLYVGYKWNDDWLFNSEIEWEHAKAGEGQRGEVAVEFAYLDRRIRPEINARAGLLLVPMGFINELHEPTIYLGARRPGIEHAILPTTWRENGAGVFGELGPITYRTYLDERSRGRALRRRRPARRRGRTGPKAVAENLAWVARIDWTAIPGFVAGVSGYVGDSAQGLADAGGEFSVDTRLLELHAEWRGQGLQVRGLWVEGDLDGVARLNRKLALTGNRSVGEELAGYYVEAGYDVLSLAAESRQALIPFARSRATTPRRRCPAGSRAIRPTTSRRCTFGIDWKPIEQLIFKADWQDVDERRRHRRRPVQPAARLHLLSDEKRRPALRWRSPLGSRSAAGSSGGAGGGEGAARRPKRRWRSPSPAAPSSGGRSTSRRRRSPPPRARRHRARFRRRASLRRPARERAGRQGGRQPCGTAYFDTHRVRTLAETVMVAIDPAGGILRVEVLSFDEPPDYLPRDEWYAQFGGRALAPETELGRAIRPVTGATLTARVTTDAARRALAIHRRSRRRGRRQPRKPRSRSDDPLRGLVPPRRDPPGGRRRPDLRLDALLRPSGRSVRGGEPPWQPAVQHLHVLAAPLLVFALGLIWKAHAWPGVRLRVAARRAQRAGARRHGGADDRLRLPPADGDRPVLAAGLARHPSRRLRPLARRLSRRTRFPPGRRLRLRAADPRSRRPSAVTFPGCRGSSGQHELRNRRRDPSPQPARTPGAGGACR